MVNRQVCILLAAAVLASVCLTPLAVRADSITPIALADPAGFFDPSLVQFGIEGLYVAVYTPAAGMSDDEILSLLPDMRNTNGLPASFDGATLIWGNTDEGQEFATEFDAVASETSSLELLGIGFVLMVLILRRRSTK